MIRGGECFLAVFLAAGAAWFAALSLAVEYPFLAPSSPTKRALGQRDGRELAVPVSLTLGTRVWAARGRAELGSGGDGFTGRLGVGCSVGRGLAGELGVWGLVEFGEAVG
ncbi:hypothetical protein GCM10023318_07800 [Nocardia callitridis]|uniref:Secreted protein n=1 Tax=Nocardia callitridis TaxID=648753 RepID=A0ABP9JWW7_9NOCA